MPSPVKITLSHEEKKQLEKNITSRKTAVRLVERSKIILLAADNVPNYRIALQLGIGVNKVGRWRNRYAERGMQGIEKDLPRGANHGGKDTAEQAKLRSKIIKMTTQEKPKDGTHWSTRGLAQVSLRSRERFWDIRVPKIDSIFDNSLVPRTSWSPGVPPQHRKLVAATHRPPI